MKQNYSSTMTTLYQVYTKSMVERGEERVSEEVRKRMLLSGKPGISEVIWRCNAAAYDY